MFLGEIHLPGPWGSESHPSERREKKVPTLSFRVDRFSKKRVYICIYSILIYLYIYIHMYKIQLVLFGIIDPVMGKGYSSMTF